MPVATEKHSDGFTNEKGAGRRVRADAQRKVDALLEATKAVFVMELSTGMIAAVFRRKGR